MWDLLMEVKAIILRVLRDIFFKKKASSWRLSLVTTIKRIFRSSETPQCIARFLWSNDHGKYTWQIVRRAVNSRWINHQAGIAAWGFVLHYSGQRHPDADFSSVAVRHGAWIKVDHVLYWKQPTNMPKLQLWKERRLKAYMISLYN